MTAFSSSRVRPAYMRRSTASNCLRQLSICAMPFGVMVSTFRRRLRSSAFLSIRPDRCSRLVDSAIDAGVTPISSAIRFCVQP